ncbi:radical SAM family protein [Streptococcus pneumoniae]|nr:radical SAM family protein [Streptococcus pneumoniae]
MTKVSINNKIDANFIKIIPILYHKKRLMETRNRGIYKKVRLLRLWVIFVIMKVIKSYNTLNDYYRKLFGEKTFKVPIDAGFDCPNRDGTVAHGGCTFCTVSGSGDAIVAPDAPIRE